MREIEFRGLTTWEIPRRWSYGSLILMQIKDFAFVSAEQVLYNTVGQFINYYDMNKRKIYEGDVVEYEDHGMCDTILNHDTYRRGEVVFDECQFCFIGKNDEWGDPCDGEIYNIKVIGNVHQNPELLSEV